MKYKLPLLSMLALGIGFSNSRAQAPASDLSPAANLRKQLQEGAAEISNYNTACYLALAGDRDFAFAYLKKAVTDDDFSNLKTIQNDSDLNTLHEDSRWGVIIAQVEANTRKGKKLEGTYFNQDSFWNSKALKTAYKAEMSDDEKVAGLSKFWSEAKYNFVNFDLVPNLNFDSLYLAYLPKVKASKSTIDYYKVMAQFCAQLRDGHTNVNPPEELYEQVYSRPLLRTRLIEDKVLVVDIFDPTLKQRGIKVGQEVLSVNGLPVKEYAAKYVTPYQSSSTPQDEKVRAFEYALFAGDLNEEIKIELKDVSGRTSMHAIRRFKPQDRSAYIKSSPFEFRMLKGNIAYVALNAFDTDSAAKAFARYYPEISKAEAIIFDVRNNGGGNSSVGWNVLSYLVKESAPIHKWYTREYKPSYRAWQNTQDVFGGGSTLRPNGKFHYNKPVVVLTGAKTFSAAEDFAAAFKSLKRGQVIGMATGGSSGQPLMISLPGNLSARICTKRDQLADGADFVGKGVLPDVEVGQTVADFRKGIDTELQFAIKTLKK
jgi:carboxyl-terminal processing protease